SCFPFENSGMSTFAQTAPESPPPGARRAMASARLDDADVAGYLVDIGVVFRMTELTRDEILATLASRGDELRRLGVVRLGLFGSFAVGAANERSDLDFLVELDQQTFDRYMDLKFWLEDVFGRPVDLVLADALKPLIRPRILQQVVDVPGL
ncbi:MAG: nucleotidyltransferase family protein, partial [Myxococcales bacterium]|nr:nucleotidyltransferase family protein [Myxococcales bacterium]